MQNDTHTDQQEGRDNAVESEFRFMDQHVLQVLIQASWFHFKYYMSGEACERFLADEKKKLIRLGDRFGFQTSIMLKNMPTSMSTVTWGLGLDCKFQEQAACP